MKLIGANCKFFFSMIGMIQVKLKFYAVVIFTMKNRLI